MYKKIYNKYIFSIYYRKDTPFYEIDFRKFYMFEELTNFEGRNYYIEQELAKNPLKIYNYITKNLTTHRYVSLKIQNSTHTVFPIFITFDGTICYIYGRHLSNGMLDSINLVGQTDNHIVEFISYINQICNKYKNQLVIDDAISKSLIIMDENNNVLGDVSIHKTFNSLYFEQKEELLNVLTRFKDKIMYPKKISMDNKLGILLYGPPGTGKTGTISAIANFLGRHVATINLSSIKRSTLNEKLKHSFYNNKVLVFDEFDCMLDVLLNKSQINSQETKEEKGSTLAEMLAVTDDKEERKNIIEMFKNGRNKNNEIVDLPYLLQKLDGLESSEGRIIIATTNNPDLINPVLLRPGRFDLKLCLSNCTSQMYVDILSAFYELDEDGRKTIMKAHLPEKKWSPLQVINTCLTTNNLNSTLKALNK